MRKSSIPIAIALAAWLLVPATAQAQAGGGCSFYGNGERERQSADRGNGFGTGGGSGSGGGSGGEEKKEPDWAWVRMNPPPDRIGPRGPTDGATDQWRLTTPPDVTREGRAMVDSFRTNMGRQHFDRRVADRHVTISKPVGGTTLGSGAVARISTGRR